MSENGPTADGRQRDSAGSVSGDERLDTETPPERPPGAEDPTTERIAWVLVLAVIGLLFLPIPNIPEGTIAAILSAVVTLLISRRK